MPAARTPSRRFSRQRRACSAACRRRARRWRDPAGSGPSRTAARPRERHGCRGRSRPGRAGDSTISRSLLIAAASLPRTGSRGWTSGRARAAHRAPEATRFRLVRRSAREDRRRAPDGRHLHAGAAPAPRQPQIAFAPCADSNEFACGHLTVPLDPSGASPGTITLAIRRHRAPVGRREERRDRARRRARAGGAPVRRTVGEPARTDRRHARSDRVRPARHRPLARALLPQLRIPPAAANPAGPAISRCAQQLGPARSFYTTADSVADIEAIRVAGGYEKLVLYGTSYGTKVAEEYAQDYPGHVEALVLDSVVPPNGPDPLNRATFAAVPRILRQLCARRACAHITRDPSRRPRQPRQAPCTSTRGTRAGSTATADGHTIGISSDALLEILLAGDLEPTLRAEFPAAVRAAAHGDMPPLARLLERRARSEAAKPKARPRASTRRSTTRRPAKRICSRGAARPLRAPAWPKPRRTSRALGARRVRPLHARRRARSQRHAGVRLLAVRHTRPGRSNRRPSRACPR